MTKIRLLLPLFLGLFLIGCATSDSESTTGTPDAAAEEEAMSSRPDAERPNPSDYAMPADWNIRFDRPSEDYVVTGDTAVVDPDIYFTNMTPGWHVTSGPAAIYWHPESTASGDYSVSSNIYLFNPGERNEAFGLFVGGSDLAGDGQGYLYFLIRKSGEFLVKQRMGDETENVVGWTAHEAIQGWPPDDPDNPTSSNVLGIQTEGDTISFMVNDQIVHSQAKGDLPTDGIVGFRVNHALNLHISTFDVQMADGGM